MAKQAVRQVFNRAQYDRLKLAQRKLHDSLAKMDAAESCGVQCQHFRVLAQDLDRRLAAIEREFMSPPPRA
jgi:hypothetical protein